MMILREIRKILQRRIYKKGTRKSFREVGSFSEVSQFQRHPFTRTPLSHYQCGFYVCLIAKSIAPYGNTPRLTARQVDKQAQQWYIRMNGNNHGTNYAGMSSQQQHDLLQLLEVQSESIETNTDSLLTWITAGYPIIIDITEASVFDFEVGGNPYPWKALGDHSILLTGLIDEERVLARDPANCTDLYDPHTLRPGPRQYNLHQLVITEATAIIPYWLPRPGKVL